MAKFCKVSDKLVFYEFQYGFWPRDPNLMYAYKWVQAVVTNQHQGLEWVDTAPKAQILSFFGLPITSLGLKIYKVRSEYYQQIL